MGWLSLHKGVGYARHLDMSESESSWIFCHGYCVMSVDFNPSNPRMGEFVIDVDFEPSHPLPQPSTHKQPQPHPKPSTHFNPNSRMSLQPQPPTLNHNHPSHPLLSIHKPRTNFTHPQWNDTRWQDVVLDQGGNPVCLSSSSPMSVQRSTVCT